MSVIVQFRDRARSNVSAMMILWSIAMAIDLFVDVVAPSPDVTIAGFVVTAVLGVYLGWRRRVGAVLFAPILSWLFAWFPLEVASMIHFGILKGFLLGLVVITVGWIAIGFVEVVWLGMVALLVRSLRRSGDGPVIYYEAKPR